MCPPFPVVPASTVILPRSVLLSTPQNDADLARSGDDKKIYMWQKDVNSLGTVRLMGKTVVNGYCRG
ncbi:unnamed protein product [Brassica rapa subsp. trilocularis]